MKYTITNERIVFEDHYKMLKAKVSYDTFKGTSITTNRLAFYRGDSVAILLFEEDTQSLILTKQFRYPTTKHDVGWMYEIPAGSMEKGEQPETCVIRETLEEVGYEIKNPELISHFYPSPGGCTERCYLFFDTVTSRVQKTQGGGVADENEDIKIVKLPVSKIHHFLKHECFDGKTIIALQWFLMTYKIKKSEND